MKRRAGVVLMGLIGLVISSLANLFFANSGLDWLITTVGVILFLVVFTVLAYLTKKEWWKDIH